MWSRIPKTDQTDYVAGVALAAMVPVIALAILLWPDPDRLPDFGEINQVENRKQAFFEYLAPMIEAENARVLAQRERLLELAERIEAGESPGWLERRRLRQLADEYEVPWNDEVTDVVLATLKQRVDRVPVALALVQAAAESGWGRSRFAVEGNNLFGQWCYTPGCGMVPGRRTEGAGHEVASFGSVRDSVRRYINNLNTHPAYTPLREIRAVMRSEGERPHALRLADGLIRYSERRQDYVDEIKNVIRVNQPIIEKVLEDPDSSGEG